MRYVSPRNFIRIIRAGPNGHTNPHGEKVHISIYRILVKFYNFEIFRTVGEVYFSPCTCPMLPKRTSAWLDPDVASLVKAE